MSTFELDLSKNKRKHFYIELMEWQKDLIEAAAKFGPLRASGNPMTAVEVARSGAVQAAETVLRNAGVAIVDKHQMELDKMKAKAKADAAADAGVDLDADTDAPLPYTEDPSDESE